MKHVDVKIHAVYLYARPKGNAASETEMTGASSDFKNILNMETNKYCSNLARMAARRGGLGENPGLFFFFRKCNAMREQEIGTMGTAQEM